MSSAAASASAAASDEAAAARAAVHAMRKPLSEADPELYKLIRAEKERQVTGLELIASENFTSRAVMDALGSCLTNKYSEGYPGRRYYGGNEVIDQIEELARARSLAAFGLSADEWAVNVQPYSGSPANFAVLTALLQPHDRIMGLALASGGHLTHGYMTPTGRRLSASSIYMESLAYGTDSESGLVDYDALEQAAARYHPKLIIAGASGYPREWDYARMRAIADAHQAYLFVDMAHVSGLVAAGEQANPFLHADVVSSTTHKSLRGPRAGIIFTRCGGKRTLVAPAGSKAKPRTVDYGALGLAARVDDAVFPGLQGGPHEHQIAAIATAMHEVAQPSFRVYAKEVRASARRLADELIARGHKLVSGGTDNHLVMLDVRPLGVTGSKVEALLERAHVSVNKNMVAGDKNAMAPGGVRVGVCAMVTRGMRADDMPLIADVLDRGARLAAELQQRKGAMKLVGFIEEVERSDELAAFKRDVHAIAARFPMPGRDYDGIDSSGGDGQ